MYYRILFFAGIVLWFVETAYFGFNMTASGGVEHFLDGLFVAFMLLGAIGMMVVDAAKEVGNNINIGIKVDPVKDQAKELMGEVADVHFNKLASAIIDDMLSYKYPENGNIPDFGCLKEGIPAGLEGLPKEIADHWEMCHCKKHATHKCTKDGVFAMPDQPRKIVVRDGDKPLNASKPKTPTNRKKTVASNSRKK